MRVNAKKTLTLRAPSERGEAPALQKKGRGWAIAESRLDKIHDRAREMRRNPTPAQTALADELTKLDLARFRFRRQQVIGSAIVDFACKDLMLVIELAGDEDAAFAATRDRSLTEVGYRVERIGAEAVLADPAGAAAHVSAIMRERWHERRSRHRAQQPGRGRQQG